MEINSQILNKAALVFSDILEFNGPADGALQLFFKKNPKLGASERKLIAELIFCALRHLQTIKEALCEPLSGKAEAILQAALYL